MVEFFRGLLYGFYNVGEGIIIALALWGVVFFLVLFGGLTNTLKYSEDLGKWFNWALRGGAIFGGVLSVTRFLYLPSGLRFGALLTAIPTAVGIEEMCRRWFKRRRPRA